MNFTINKRYFYERLSIVSRAISVFSPLPAFSGIKIDVVPNSIVLTGSDSDISIRSTILPDEDNQLTINDIGSIVIEDGMFLACDASLKHKAVMRSTFSSAVAGNEGLFNLGLNGNGVVCLESMVPQEELIEIELQDDVLKIDGNMAIAWSSTLQFTVERSGKSLIGSAASGEGLVNVYRGTGKVLMAPVL